DPGLEKFDCFVTVGVPPSKNPALYDRKIAKFVLDCNIKYPDALLLTCVGSFYEASFKSIELASLLNIKKATYPMSGYKYPFSGFPNFALPRHLRTLVNDHGRTVAIAEQVPSVTDSFERQLVRIITPGTILDENMIDSDSHNFLLAIVGDQLAWLDVSTGAYYKASFEGDQGKLTDYICRIAPKEIIIPKRSGFKIPSKSKAAKLSIPITKLETLGDALEGQRNGAEALMSQYLKHNFLPAQVTKEATNFNFSSHLNLDAETIDDLEVLTTQNGKSKAGCLISTISRTITKPGKRLLRDRITAPSTVLPEIESRLDLVEDLVYKKFLREDLQDLLRLISEVDYIRLLQRLNLKTGNVEDLISLNKVLKTIALIHLSSNRGSEIFSALGNYNDLVEKISEALNQSYLANEEQPSVSEIELAGEDEAKESFALPRWDVCSNYSKEISNFHKALGSALELGHKMQENYRFCLNSKDLKLICTSKFGAVVSFKKPKGKKEEWKKILVELNGHRLFENNSRIFAATKEWTNLNIKIEEIKGQILQSEKKIIAGLFEEVDKLHGDLRKSFEYLSELDVSQSFATFAAETNCIRPSLKLENSTVIINGRHPISEQALTLNTSGTFQPNSVVMKEDDGLCQIITGPNNGGKSTFLRQVAVAHLLAQAGSFVPSENAELGLVTQILTRFGSHDDMTMGKGTFWIEMEETAKILKRANRNSLVVIDELGRGTGNEDGLSIAYGVFRYLADHVKCRTLFATHLHQLVPLLAKDNNFTKVDKVGFFYAGSSQMIDSQGKNLLLFPHKIFRGLNTNSCGIEVATIAGLPSNVIGLAKNLKQSLGSHYLNILTKKVDN
ncbi:muts domain V-domain-containing protein, partial [Phakopsora pachyrhizi]